MPWRMLSAFTSHDISRLRRGQECRSYRPPLVPFKTCVPWYRFVFEQRMRRRLIVLPSFSNNRPSEQEATTIEGHRAAASGSESHE